jgi:hypothetical protein
VAGAAVGCVIGHHRAKVKERERERERDREAAQSALQSQDGTAITTGGSPSH